MSFSSSSAVPPPVAGVLTYGVTASQFCAVAQSYDLARPDYPDSCIKELLKTLGVAKDSTVIDLGAGTGKLTKALLRAWNPNVKDDELAKARADNLLAVEVAHDMRTQFSKQFPTIRVVGGMAEDTRVLNDSQADFVIVGTAFHWFKDISIQEIARILKPRGGLGLIWNMLDPKDPENDWVRECRELLEPNGDARNHDTGQWKALFMDTYLFSNPFANHVTRTYKIEGTVEDVINCLKSFSAFAKLSHDEKEKYVQKVRQILSTHPKTKGKEKIEVPFRVEMYTCTKRRKLLKRSALPNIGGPESKRALIMRTPSGPSCSQDDIQDDVAASTQNSLIVNPDASVVRNIITHAPESEDELGGSPIKGAKLSRLFSDRIVTSLDDAKTGDDVGKEEKKEFKPRGLRNLLAELSGNAARVENNKS